MYRRLYLHKVTPTKMKSPVLLVILDGWGINPNNKNNAVHLAKTPHFDYIWNHYPHTQLNASGEDVGLPSEIMGNSEVGHLNLGAGRVVQQKVTQIDRAIETGEYFNNIAFNQLMSKVRSTGGRIHLVGLASNGLVHSSEKHYLALLELANRHGFRGDQVQFHAIVDGRDTPRQSAFGYLKKIEKELKRWDLGSIASVIGRYYAMDRDNHWDRISRAYELYTAAQGYRSITVDQAIQAAYDRGETDEFISPTVITSSEDISTNIISDGDAIILFNYRADRSRQLIKFFTDTDFREINREKVLDISIATMTIYDKKFNLPCAFPPTEPMESLLGNIISQAGLSQLRVAETEKYAHVTYFFNGGSENPFPGEDRILVPSPRDVSTYDEKPEMSASEVSRSVVDALHQNSYDFVLVNFANPDMVGHTGSLSATIRAVETVDRCLGELVESIGFVGGSAIVTADHGNAEMMIDPVTMEPHTAHTTNQVPFVLINEAHKNIRLRENGRLADVAPTVLSLLNISDSNLMSGMTLL